MDHISTDTKLKLVQMIRNENQENRMKMRSREQLINSGYHSGSYRENAFQRSAFSGNAFSEQEAHPFWGLRLRIGAAFLLFLGFLFLDYTGVKMGSIGAGEIVSWINKEIDINSIDFIENLTYTLSE